MKNKLYVACFFFISCIFVFCVFNSKTIERQHDCIGSYEEFAFEIINEQQYHKNFTKLYPMWNQYFEFENNENITETYNIEIVRYNNEKEEVWIRKSYFEERELKYSYYIYFPETNMIRRVNAAIEDLDIQVYSLFFNSNDNSIWGLNKWNYENNKGINLPLFSRFNENEMKFEIDQASNQSFFNEFNYLYWDNFLMDKNNNFWFITPTINEIDFLDYEQLDQSLFIENIYLYNLNTRNFQHKKTLIDIEIDDISFSKDGDIYILESFNDNDEFITWQNKRQRIYKYSAIDNEIYYLSIIPEYWITIDSILVDSLGNLWLDSIGIFEESDGLIFNDLHSNVSQLKESFLQYKYGNNFPAARVLFESSDGKIWFRDDTESDIKNGVAWFNPKTKEGCWVTNIAGYPVEGPNQIIWMMIENRLYSYDLKDK